MATGIPSSRRNKRSKTNVPESLKKGAYLFCFIMSLPAIYGIAKYLIVNSYSILLAFYEGTPFQSDFTFRHFQDFFTDLNSSNGVMLVGLKNTLIYFGIGLVKQFISYFAAYFLFKKVRGYKFARFILFLPCIIPVIVSVNIYRLLIQKNGSLWWLISALFDNKQPWTGPNANLAIYFYVIFFSGIGTSYLVFIGEMNRIPKEMLESAKLDGVGIWREFWRFIVPLTWGTFSTFLLMSTATLFTASGPILFFVDQNLEQAYTLNIQTFGFILYERIKGNGFVTYYNSASAVGLILSIWTLPLVLFTRWLSNKLDSGVTY